MTTNEKAKEMRREYLNNWRAKNKDKVREANKRYWQRKAEKRLQEENAKKYPKYQREYGDWLNWNIPNTDCNVPIFASGWGDGAYPSYFGYDAEGNVCSVYIHFIDIAQEYDE